MSTFQCEKCGRDFFYTDEGEEIFLQSGFRPSNPDKEEDAVTCPHCGHRQENKTFAFLV